MQRADEDSLLILADHLPPEAAEALLDLATGAKPKPAALVRAGSNPFEHPDAQRRFRLVSNVEELQRALDYPWEKWAIFLHPAQRQLIERNYNGPARVSGSAGTGKTIVALHRAAHLARTHPEARLLLTTFSDTLCSALAAKLHVLLKNEPAVSERIEVHSIYGMGRRLYESRFGPAKTLSRETLDKSLLEALKSVADKKFALSFLRSEWEQVVDAWQIQTSEAYRDVQRLGRKTRLPEKQRLVLWSLFEIVKADLAKQNVVSWATLFTRLALDSTRSNRQTFDFAIVDEAQDISIAQLRYLASLGASEPNRLFFAGDLGQRIFGQPFSWRTVGVDVRGRSATLKINYWTSHQIRMQADRLLGPEVSDVDGNREERKGTVSVFNGPVPAIEVFETIGQEWTAVANWLSARKNEGFLPHEMGVFVRSKAQIDRAVEAAQRAGLTSRILDERVQTEPGCLSISTMHGAKGLEFRAVAVMGCDDEVIPLQERIEAVADESDLEEVYNTERHLLYVACTRARDQLLITAVRPASEYLDDLCT